jgi:hypothetical protein
VGLVSEPDATDTGYMGSLNGVRSWAIAVAVVLAVLVAALLFTQVFGDDNDACSKFSAENCTKPVFSPEK